MIDRGWSPPESFDDYRIERVLGWGGMGVVYLGYDRLLQRERAIKFLQVNNSTIYRQRFTMEAQAVARIHHPNVVTIYVSSAESVGERGFWESAEGVVERDLYGVVLSVAVGVAEDYFGFIIQLFDAARGHRALGGKPVEDQFTVIA